MIITSNPLPRSSVKPLLIPHPSVAKSLSHQFFHFMLAMAGHQVTGFHGLKQRFFGQIGSELSAILVERRAVILLDRRNVVISAEAIDVTNELIRRIDAAIGDGTEAPDAPDPN